LSGFYEAKNGPKLGIWSNKSTAMAQ